MAVQALTYLHRRGHRLDGPQLITEALRKEWPRQSSLKLAKFAGEINAGKRLRLEARLEPEVLGEWANAV